MNLTTYINRVGVATFATQLGVSYHTAYEWARGTRIPRREEVHRIVDETPVTFAGVYGREPEEEDAA